MTQSGGGETSARSSLRLARPAGGSRTTTLVPNAAKAGARLEWMRQTVRIRATMTLAPGDVILTGTPAGGEPLAPGDEVRVEIEGVGVLINPVRAEAEPLQ